MGTNTPHTCIPGLVWQKQARRFSQFEFKVGKLRFPIHFVCVSAALYHRGVRSRHFPLRWIWPIDSNLSWEEQVDHVCLKVNRKIGALRRSFRQLCPVARRLFYLSIIQPDFDFGSSAFIPNILMSQRKRLVATWRRAVRAVAGSGYQEDVAPLLKALMIDPIEHRWVQHVAVTTFRCRHGTAPPDLRKKLKSVDHGRTTRGASGKLCAISFFFNLWNSIFFQSCSPYLELSSQWTTRSRFC